MIECKILGGAGVGTPFAKGKFAVGGTHVALAGEAETFLESGGGGFGMVWVGLALFWIEGLYARRPGGGMPLPELGEG